MALAIISSMEVLPLVAMCDAGWLGFDAPKAAIDAAKVALDEAVKAFKTGFEFCVMFCGEYDTGGLAEDVAICFCEVK